MKRGRAYSNSLPYIQPLQFTSQIIPMFVRSITQERVNQHHSISLIRLTLSSKHEEAAEEKNSRIERHNAISTSQSSNNRLQQIRFPSHLSINNIKPEAIHSLRSIWCTGIRRLGLGLRLVSGGRSDGWTWCESRIYFDEAFQDCRGGSTDVQ